VSSERSTSALQINFALLASLTFMMSLTPFTADAFLPAFPDASETFGVSASTMQLTLTAFLIGIACGQLVFGPLSDRFGRRGPLLIGAGLCAAAAIAAALAPSATVLVLARLAQGLAGSAAMVIGKAIVRDRTAGADTTAVLSVTTVATGVLNIFAPITGGFLAGAFGWRGTLWFIAVAATALFVLVLLVVPETLERERRSADGLRWLGVPEIVGHLRNRRFVMFVVIQSGSYGTLMAYVASSPFVYQNVLGFDATTYGILFAVNSLCAVSVNFFVNRFLRRFGSINLVTWGLGLSMLGTAVTAVAYALDAPAVVLAACITCSMAPLGMNGPNLVGLSLNQVTRSVGAAAAAIGFLQFCTGSIVSPVVGLFGDATLWPQVVAMTLLAGTSMTWLIVARRSTAPVEVAEPRLAG
jgi:MFS transporter, DHA1 family, multidrug resistance protein